MQPGKITFCKFLYTWRWDYASLPQSHVAPPPPPLPPSSLRLPRSRRKQQQESMREAVKEPLLQPVWEIFGFLCAVWGPAECEEISHRERATSWKYVISIRLLLIGDVSAVEWVMTREPPCSAADGLKIHTQIYDTSAHGHITLIS